MRCATQSLCYEWRLMEIRVAAFCLPMLRSMLERARPATSLHFPAFTPTAGAFLSTAPAHRTALRISPHPAF
jgi:hypothetical protein